MAGFNTVIDITNIPPEQSMANHALGKFLGRIENTKITPTKDEDGGMLVIMLSSPGGSIDWRLNLWNPSAKAVEIAHKQLSALGHCIGVFKFDMNNECAAIRGAPLMYDVIPQPGNEKYNQVGKVYDANGNEPGKAPTNQAGAFGAQPSPAANAATASPAPANAWGAPTGQPAAQTFQQQPVAQQGWQQGGAAAGSADKPPWQK